MAHPVLIAAVISVIVGIIVLFIGCFSPSETAQPYIIWTGVILIVGGFIAAITLAIIDAYKYKSNEDAIAQKKKKNLKQVKLA